MIRLAVQAVVALIIGLILFFALIVWAMAQEVPREAYRYRPSIIKEGRAVWGLDAPSADFAAQIHQESRWRADARSPVGAQGLAQFMPATARWIAGVYPLDLAGAVMADPQWSIRALVRYDKWLWDRVQARNECERLAFAMSAYNGGLGWVNRRKAVSDDPLRCFAATCDINPGITAANQRENREYPRVILLRWSPVFVANGFGGSFCEAVAK